MILKRKLNLLLFLFSIQFAQAQCWNLVWEDDFNGSSLDASNWSDQTGAGGWGNNELQYYTNLSTNLSVSGGTLQITAQEESYMGSDYTSSRIRSINKSDWTYGKMEARIKLPEGQGIWPAFWMMPTDSEYGGWPASGEVDIMEFLGHQTATSYGTVHYGYVGDHQYMGTSYSLPTGIFPGSFHDFTIEWEAAAIRWYVDGNLYYTITPSNLGVYPWVFDKDFHFILNLAVGGDWPGNPDPSTIFPQTMEVDYVRVYQLLTDIKIEGDDYVQPNDASVIYSVPSIFSTTYTWNVPFGASITSGQGTNAIVVNWGSTSGNITCNLVNGCGSEISTFAVEVNPNFFENPAFENDFINWNTGANNGAVANFSITTTNPQEGTNAAEVSVITAGSNVWDVQLQRSGFSLEGGETYSLSFWAKAATNGLQFPVAFVKNQSPWTWYGGTTVTMTTTWTEYTLNFTPSVSDDVLFNIDLGGNTADFYFDNFVFGKTSALPIELANFSVKNIEEEKSLLNWSTYSENKNDFFEILKGNQSGEWKSIGKVSGQGNSQQLTTYQFIDQAPFNGFNYYQLRQVDLDGTYSLSTIRSTFFDKNKILSIFPNPTSNSIFLKNHGGGRVSIFNVNGQMVFQNNFEKNEVTEISIPSLTKGIYFLKVRHKDEVKVFRFLKE